MWSKTASLLRKFGRSEKGSTSIIFAVSAIPMLALAGGVIDYSLMQEARTRLQLALDAGVLAAMKEKGANETKIRKIIADYVVKNFGRKGAIELNPALGLTVEVKRTLGAMRLKASITGYYRPAFMSLLGVKEVAITAKAEAKQSSAGFEVVMVLDNTGSMEGKKIKELREAANALIDTMEEAARSADVVRAHVGLVPYNVYVNVGTDKWNKPWLRKNGLHKSEWKGLVGMRRQSWDISDGGYSSHRIPAVLNYLYAEADENSGWVEIKRCVKKNRRGGCDEEVEANLPAIMPLTDIRNSGNVTKLKDRVNAMKAFSGTNIPLGLVWGWRVLSAHKPFTQAWSYDKAKKEQVEKIIVLMTDGWNSCFDNNRTFDMMVNGHRHRISRGMVSCRPGYGPKSPEADDRLRKLCTRIKNKGIRIITVGYDIEPNSSVETLMKQCQNLGYYRADVGDLKKVFEQIADKVTKLHLSR